MGRNHSQEYHSVARVNFAYKTNNEDNFLAFGAADAEFAPRAKESRFGVLMIAALCLAASCGVALAVLH
jgi:hypothetical protein